MSSPAMFAPREPREPEVGTSEDWGIIEAALGFKDFDPHRREGLFLRLRSLFRVYFPHYELPDLHVANYTRALKRLKEDADRLRNDISIWWADPAEEADNIAEIREICENAASDEELDERLSARSLARAAERRSKEPFINFHDNDALALCVNSLLPDDRREALLAMLGTLIADVDIARRQFGNSKGGRRNDWRFDKTMEALARIYFETTQRVPRIPRNDRGLPYGDFIRFVKTTFRVFAPKKLPGDEAVVKRFKKVRRKDGKKPSGGT
jgi:hypothetical protein